MYVCFHSTHDQYDFYHYKKPFAWDKRFFVFNIDVRIDFFNANSNIELHSIG